MAIQVDPTVSPRIITIPETDGASITIQSLVNQIRAWEDNQANLSYAKLLSASGKEDLGSETLVGITAKLENTKLKFEAREVLTTCYVGGGNLVAVDVYGVTMFPIEPSSNVTVQLTQSSSATMVQSADITTIKAKTDNLPDQPADQVALEAVIATRASQSTIDSVKNKTDTIDWTDITFVRQVEQGRWKIVNNQMIFYASNGTTPIRTFNLKDANGQPTMENVYERTPI